MTEPTQQGISSTGGMLGNSQAPLGSQSQTALNNVRQPSQFPTLNPPVMRTAVYAPNAQIIISADANGGGIPYDVSPDIVRGSVARKENSVSSLFFTLANKDLRYTTITKFARMDRVTCYLTRLTPIQSFSGYLDTIPWMQAYPGTVDFRASCTLKRLLYTYWNPSLPQSLSFFENMGANLGTAGDGQGGAVTDSGIGSILREILQKVGNWPAQSVHVQDFPQQFIIFLNNYFVAHHLEANNNNLQREFSALILGNDLAPGPMGAVGYEAGDPLGTAATAASSGTPFYVSQFVAATDHRGMGPVVTNTANSATVNEAADIFESAPSAANPYTAALAKVVQQAGQQVSQYSSNWSTQNQNSDAAILTLAAAMVASGGSPQLMMWANNSDPATLSFFNTGVYAQGSGAGLFLLPNDGSWGTPSQRMNPFSSASMFLDRLNSVTGWRNMDPGQAIWQVLQTTPANIPLYTAAVKEATPIVLAYRQATQQNSASQALGGVIPGAGALGNIAGGGANPLGGLAGNTVGLATTSPMGAASAVAQTGQPVPNSEGAINAAMAYLSTPYSQEIGGGSTPGVGLDCSGLIQASFASIGIQVPRNTYGQIGFIPSVPINSIQRGDVIQTNHGGHTGIYLGGGTWINTGGPDGTPGKIAPLPTGPGGIMWAGRLCSNGGPNPAAPWTPNFGGHATGVPMGTGIPPGAGTGGVGGGAGGGGADEPIARNLFSYLFLPSNYASAAADFFTGEKAYIDDQPLMQIVKALCTASLRSFQSSPSGDFVAYYPDPFGMDGKPAILALEDIELKDVHIDISDDNLTTHVYIEGDNTMLGQADQVTGWLGTCGVMTVQNPLFPRLASVAPGDIGTSMSPSQLLNRFGVRPYKDAYSIAGNAGLEFLLATQIFMGKWASQYETDIGMTFMPELLPGMRILLVGHNLTVYCSAVTHEFDWEHGFRTMATVSAATDPNAASNIYSAWPGSLSPTNTNPGSNTNNGGQPVPNPGWQPILPGGPLDYGAGGFISDSSPLNAFPGS